MANDGPRDRELHRYYQPWLETFHTSSPALHRPTDSRSDGHVPQNSKDHALTAFAQLGALRIGLKRGIVTLIDSKNQYVLAEATRTVSIMDDSRHAQGDELWLGNAVLPRAQGVSADALAASTYVAKGPGTDEFSAPALVIDDLVHDNRYARKAYAGSGIRFYAGVPLVTRLGHSIGVYNVTDDNPKKGLNAEELRIMVDMAAIVVNHLDTIKNDRARARGERLIRGIGNFIEGASSHLPEDTPDISASSRLVNPLDDTPPTRLERPTLTPRKESSYNFKGMTISDMNAAAREQYSSEDERNHFANGVSASRTIDLKLPSKAASTLNPQVSSPKKPVSAIDQNSASKTKSQYLAVFERAARILRKSMSADGVVFVDASAANLSKGTHHKSSRSNPAAVTHYQSSRPGDSKASIRSVPIPSQARLLGLPNDDDSFSSDNQASSVDWSERPVAVPHFCETIAGSLRDRHVENNVELSEAYLRRLVRRFPQGRVYSFDSTGRAITSDESSESAGPLSDSSNPATQPQRPYRSKNALLGTLPDARTIVFLPLWDFAKERWNSAAIIWSTNPAKLMNIRDDLSYLTAFGNSVINEVSRLNLAVSDTAKATFLANISHELRSPLHGILGSIEFLHESPLDDFQSNMVLSVETCGKTLLDTVNHVLDFAKLNNLSKSVSQRKDGVTQATTSDSSLTSHFDLAVVVEEAVEAVYAGQVFRTANSDTLEGKGPIMSASRKALRMRQDTKERIAQGQHNNYNSVRLTLNIDDGARWHITSQPGAVRRVVMNLLGNALKYTEKGSINVSLEIDHSRDHEDDGHLHSCMTVSDTGRGMSNDFVKNRAFTAFSQEDSLASGTGLGLSIIRQIVDSLGGKIDLKSQKDLGTEVKIWLSFPLYESALIESSREITVLKQIQERTGGLRMCMLTPDIVKSKLPDPRPSLSPLPTVEDAARSILNQWFSMRVFMATSMDSVATDFFMYAEPPPIEYLLHNHGEHAMNKEVPIIIICANAFQASALRDDGIHTLTELGRIIEIMAQPVGPQKLAKVLQRCLQRMKKLDNPAISSSSEPVPRTVQKDDDLKAPPPQTRPKLGRSAASLDRIQVQRSAEKRPGAPRSTTNVHFPGHGKETDHKDETPNPTNRPAPTLSSPVQHDPSLPRVLVVDDNSINLNLLETMVRKAKHPYESANNGLKAVEAYKKSTLTTTTQTKSCRFKYILMDITMPVMDGVQATKEIRKWEKEKRIAPPVQIFALTGMGDESVVKTEAKETGFDRFLSKPVGFKELIALLV